MDQQQVSFDAGIFTRTASKFDYVSILPCSNPRASNEYVLAIVLLLIFNRRLTGNREQSRRGNLVKFKAQSQKMAQEPGDQG